jgi:hypothetical protein
VPARGQFETVQQRGKPGTAADGNHAQWMRRCPR